ncbi:MAG: tetratricopeptide repeat protein [Armatimonadota bacterium]|nr:MAG: tetratricopeptide repeat protein [Armatimonadota bacterium]
MGTRAPQLLMAVAVSVMLTSALTIDAAEPPGRQLAAADEAQALCNLGLSHFGQGRWEDALAAYEGAAKIRPDLPEAHCGMGCAYGSLGQPRQALAAYEEAVRLDPDMWEAHAGLGHVFVDLGRHREAAAAYRRALELKPEKAGIHLSLAWTYEQLERWEQARQAARRATELTPGDALAHYHLGFACAKLRRWQEAVDAFGEAVRLDSESEDARLNLEWARTNLLATTGLGWMLFRRIDDDDYEPIYGPVSTFARGGVLWTFLLVFPAYVIIMSVSRVRGGQREFRGVLAWAVLMWPLWLLATVSRLYAPMSTGWYVSVAVGVVGSLSWVVYGVRRVVPLLLRRKGRPVCSEAAAGARGRNGSDG